MNPFLEKQKGDTEICITFGKLLLNYTYSNNTFNQADFFL
jgi:hypothetical protein